jgi:hypothetical protein
LGKLAIAGGRVVGNVTSFGLVTLDGTEVGGNVSARTGSIINMSGGAIGGDMVASLGGQLEISGGAVTGEIIARDTSAVSMTGGQAEHLHLSGIATAFVGDGDFGRVTAADISTLAFSGQVAGLLRTEGSTAVTIRPGATIANIEALGESQITMRGGDHSGLATLRHESSMTIEAGSVGVFDVEDDASLLVDNTQSGAIVRTGEIRAGYGGQLVVTGPKDLFIKEVFIRNGSVAFLNGGDIERFAIAWDDNSTLNVTYGALIRGGMHARFGAAINMDAGEVRGLVELFGDSTLALSGGTVARNFIAHGENFLDLDGGQMELVRAEQKSEIIFGGAAAAKVVQVADFGRLIMHGGRVATDLVGTERAVLSVSGTALGRASV